jgi:hypothetical protein
LPSIIRFSRDSMILFRFGSYLGDITTGAFLLSCKAGSLFSLISIVDT